MCNLVCYSMAKAAHALAKQDLVCYSTANPAHALAKQHVACNCASHCSGSRYLFFQICAILRPLFQTKKTARVPALTGKRVLFLYVSLCFARFCVVLGRRNGGGSLKMKVPSCPALVLVVHLASAKGVWSCSSGGSRMIRSVVVFARSAQFGLRSSMSVCSGWILLMYASLHWRGCWSGALVIWGFITMTSRMSVPTSFVLLREGRSDDGGVPSADFSAYGHR